MSVAENLKAQRKAHKQTQEDIALKLGITRSSYAYYETGKSVPPLETLKKISLMYNVSIDSLADNIPEDSDGAFVYSAVAEKGADPLTALKKNEQSLIMFYRLLDKKSQKELMEKASEMLVKATEKNKKAKTVKK